MRRKKFFRPFPVAKKGKICYNKKRKIREAERVAKKQTRAEKKAEEKRAVAEMEEAMRKDAPKEPGKDSGSAVPAAAGRWRRASVPNAARYISRWTGRR